MWADRPGGERIPLFSQSAPLSKNQKIPTLLLRLLWCGPGSLTAVRQGTCDLSILNVSKRTKSPSNSARASVVWDSQDASILATNIPSKKDQNILVRVLWCGPAPTRRGNRLKCFYDHLLFENQNPRHRCWGFCGVGRDRTGDTRIFSPLLYRLSYRTIPTRL